MNLFRVSLRNLRIRLLSSTLTTISIVVGTGLLAALWLLIAETNDKYRSNTLGYDAVVGPKEGAPLALVLNTVFNLGFPPGIVPMKVYRELHDGNGRIEGYNRRVGISYAIPQARGDNYKNFPIVGTTDEMFSKFYKRKDEEKNKVHLRFAQGEPFSYSHEQFLAFADELAQKKARGTTNGNGEIEPPVGDGNAHGHTHADGTFHRMFDAEHRAVIGAEVASELGLGVGGVITPVHGATDDIGAHVHHEDECEIVGVLERTWSPIDRVIYIPISTFLSMDKHDAIRDAQEAAADNVGLSAIIVRPIATIHREHLRYAFQTRRDAQVAVPGTEVASLLEIVGNATDVLRVVSYLVLIVAGVSILVALYNTMNERRREIAIMRSLGARRWQIVRIILQEALLISLLGGVLGVGFCHLAAFGLAGTVADMTGVYVDASAFSIEELWLIIGVGALGGLAGILPAIKGSMTEVADNLGPVS